MLHSEPELLTPTCPTVVVPSEMARWRRVYGGSEYYYGHDAGPVARRALRYHRPYLPWGGTALDVGCGEGQDVAYLAGEGYAVTGLELTPEGVFKSRRLLNDRELQAEVLQGELPGAMPAGPFDVVLAVNVLQFLGESAEAVLEKIMGAVKPGGILGLSLFACCDAPTRIDSTIFFISPQELLRRFSGWQPMEAASVWQWNLATGEPQEFVTLIVRNTPPTSNSIELS